MSGSKDILIANLRAEIAAGRAGEESSAEERRVVGQLLDELLPKRIAEAESYGYDNGFRDGLRTALAHTEGRLDALRGIAGALLFGVGVCDLTIDEANEQAHLLRVRNTIRHREALLHMFGVVCMVIGEELTP